MGSLQVFPLDVTGVKYPFKDHRTIIGRPISATDSTKHQAFQAKFNPDIPQITSRFEFHVKTLSQPTKLHYRYVLKCEVDKNTQPATCRK